MTPVAMQSPDALLSPVAMQRVYLPVNEPLQGGAAGLWDAVVHDDVFPLRSAGQRQQHGVNGVLRVNIDGIDPDPRI